MEPSCKTLQHVPHVTGYIFGHCIRSTLCKCFLCCRTSPPYTVSLISCQKEFSKAALRITNLYECWRNVLSGNSLQLQTPTSHISRVAGIQFAVIAKQGIADCEIQMLSKLDDLIQRSKRPSKERELCIWAGIWTLVLLYRDILWRYLQMSRYKDSSILSEYNFVGSEFWLS